MSERPESRSFEPTLFQRDEGVEPRYTIVVPWDAKATTFSSDEALTRGIAQFVADAANEAPDRIRDRMLREGPAYAVVTTHGDPEDPKACGRPLSWWPTRDEPRVGYWSCVLHPEVEDLPLNAWRFAVKTR